MSRMDGKKTHTHIVVLQRFAEDPLIVSDLVYLDDAPKGEDGRPRKEGTLEMVRRAVWGMLYADDAGVVSTSPRGLTRMMGAIVVTCQEFGLTVSEKKTEAMHLWSHPHTTSNALRIEAAGQRYKQTIEFVYLGGAISESADLDIEIKRRIGAAWASVRKYSSQLYDRRNARLSLKIRLFKAEVMEAMLYGCATWTMRSQDFSSLRTAHHKLLLRIIGFRRKDRIGYNRLTRDGTAEPVSRDQILRHARGQGNIYFPCSADHEQDWKPYPVDPYHPGCLPAGVDPNCGSD